MACRHAGPTRAASRSSMTRHRRTCSRRWGRPACEVFASISRPRGSRICRGTPTPPGSSERTQRRQWDVQLNTSLAIIAAEGSGRGRLRASGVRPFRWGQGDLGLQQPGLATWWSYPFGQGVREDLGGLSWEKQAPDYADVVPLAQALIAANADRVVWGTDWPHPTGRPPGANQRMSRHSFRLMTADC